MRVFLKKLHKWLSIPVGIIITIVCLTGAILVFQDEILEISNPSHYFIEYETSNPPILLEELIPLVNAQLDTNAVASVQISDDPARTYRMTLEKGFRQTAFVNQYTGRVTGYYKFQESPFYTIMRLHRWLLDGTRTWGKYTVGISTLLFVFILISGFIVWMPRRMNKSRFKIQLRKGRKRLFYDLHNVLGAYACLVLLICALTGMMWSFDWYRNTVFRLFGAKVKQEQGQERGQRGDKDKGEQKEVNYASWQTVFGELKTSNPDYEYIRIQDGSATVHQKSSVTSRAADQYAFDKRSGEITKATLFKDQEGTVKVWAWVYSLHVGNYWGVWSKIFTCFFSLAGASLPITGYYIFFVKRKERQKVKDRKTK
ncbi:putative iron-regulated membrane protein [Dysgonomonas sp. PFB1-18]|uniref:PepSY-associated TM helix domain-containing protein n=1 Tax=unclassified Dysgonomonas TaxID=2630389 RepID=UPI00247464C8|nr:MULTISPECIES: PepSY-associated TM helix domain-containing protein [unclassified Dysgonomonas]MDH6307422.1 putative iron-regulated membrane protein [Dysgonomonas sp. PF1-14]MDH6337340.1 putative iron-regulated membrane protein [Dysgonomonas sp. PF1-16]MDH6379264.1 putative iron-regulated membrane protein [Dysgonomonas sp. PFB1-18]MDH6396098.1 putative iron-regulated membrane protein [Dysgonomonas sp. PF1-23]